MQTLTTAIVYPNNRVHVGWGWECLGADWMARTYRALGEETFFSTGMDEHSLKVQRAAEAKGLEPKAYCDSMAEDIRRVLDQMGMKYDRFIRTSDEDHHRVVTHLVKRCYEKGDIYQAKYEGYYDDVTETFYSEKELVDGLCPVSKSKPRWISEENYFFRLSKYQDQLLKLFEDRPDFLRPENRKNEVLNFIKQGLKDFSISRSNFTWGIPLPFEKSHVIYVWFDALINYLTATGVEAKLRDPSSAEARAFDEKWSSVFHIIGKDISRFHCVFWPAMLMSMELPLPKGVFAHGFVQLKGEKISKSTGNIVTPDDVIKVTGPDAFRYYLLAENSFAGDAAFSWESLMLKNNADLSNDFGNLVNRSISMTRKYFPEEGLLPPKKLTHSQKIVDSFQRLVGELRGALAEVDPSVYAKACTQRSRELNLYIDETKPWALAKDPSKREELAEVLYTLLEGIRWIATGLTPILPFNMPKVFQQLEVKAPLASGSLVALKWAEVPEYRPGAPSPIFARIELPEGLS